jgi:hypothetical protein
MTTIPERQLDPPEGVECEPGSSFCHEKCESWHRSKCEEAAHDEDDCWFDCSHCDKEENRGDHAYEKMKDERLGL